MEAEHRVQLELLRSPQEALRGGEAAGNLLRSVEDWLLTHMKTSDEALTAHFAEHGPRPQ